MLLITARVQVPDYGLDNIIVWEPTYMEHILRHVHMRITINIVVFPQIPIIQIEYTSDFAYEY